jgi:hypothetical protein
MHSLNEFLTTLSGFLTPVIAILAVMIAYHQYKIQAYRVRMDLFDRRLKIYNAIMDFMNHIRRHGDAGNDQIFELIKQTVDSKFLFKGKIKLHIDSLLQKALALQEVNKQLANPSLLVGDERTRLVKEMTIHFKSLREQYNQTDELFAKYIKLDE